MTLSAAIVEYCSPTLAGIKAAGLFGLIPEDREAFVMEANEVRSLLTEKGIGLKLIETGHNGRILCYLYRFSQIESILTNEDNLSFLEERGYTVSYPDEILRCLFGRLAVSAEFPHEVGLFLGYPLDDVRAFIENRGQNCICCGCWKVYSNEEDAVAQFHRCKSCTALYKTLYGKGRTLQDLAVAA